MNYVMTEVGAWTEMPPCNTTLLEQQLNQLQNLVIIQGVMLTELYNKIIGLEVAKYTQATTSMIGQAINDYTIPKPVNYVYNRVAKKEALIREVIVDTPKPANVDYETPSFRSSRKLERGEFNIMNRSGEWHIEDQKIVNRQGRDLALDMPIRFSEERSIIGYVVKRTNQGIEPFFVYKAKDSFGSWRILEAGINFWRSLTK